MKCFVQVRAVKIVPNEYAISDLYRNFDLFSTIDGQLLTIGNVEYNNGWGLAFYAFGESDSAEYTCTMDNLQDVDIYVPYLTDIMEIVKEKNEEDPEAEGFHFVTIWNQTRYDEDPWQFEFCGIVSMEE